MLQHDLDRRSTVKELIPHRHVVQQVIAHFRGESYHKADCRGHPFCIGAARFHQEPPDQDPIGQQTVLCISKRGRLALHADEAALAGRRRRDNQSRLVIIVTETPTNHKNFAQLLM
jgi:hypothetical protein